MEIFLGFLGGVAVTLIGAYIRHNLSVGHENKSLENKKLLEIYHKLMELKGVYFYVSSSEFSQTPIHADLLLRCKKHSWRILDMIREVDELEFNKRLIEVILSETKFQSAKERYEEMNSLLDEMGERVNPKYNVILNRVCDTNTKTNFFPKWNNYTSGPGNYSILGPLSNVDDSETSED